MSEGAPSPAALGRALERRWEEEHGVRLTRHARERMAEMGVTAAQVLAILDRPSVTRPTRTRDGGREALLAVRDELPLWAVVFNHEAGARVVITVVFRETGEYERDGAGYTLR